MRMSNWSSDVCSSDLHGQITGIMKAQIDHLPLAYKGLRPTQGRTLAVMQVCAGSQSFNTINTLRVLGRWMRMRSEEHTSELQSLMRISYAVFCLKKKKIEQRIQCKHY